MLFQTINKFSSAQASPQVGANVSKIKRSSVLTEVDANWNPVGDDQTRGWLWTARKYDWKGRVVRKINTDGADSPVLNASDQLFSYEGCGCAGGQVTTIESELVPRDDQPNTFARRKQKVYQDILGRTYMSEVMNWDGATVYTSTVQTFDGRDNVVNTGQYAGNSGSSTYQDVWMTYDGHGRLKTRHYPVEDTGTDTEFFYNADGSVQQTIDPRVLQGWTSLTVQVDPLPASRADPSQGDYNYVQMNDFDAS